MIGIVDYGMGNLHSVCSAFTYLGADIKVCHTSKDLDQVNKIVIPGVGAFKDCINSLENSKLIDALERNVIKQQKPTLGICLGMQIMATKGFEGGIHKGLGWFDAEIILLHPSDNQRIPNIGWVEISYSKNNPIFKGLPQNPDYYVVHSYYMKCNNENDIVATYDYGQTVTAAVMKNNIFASQFHPEKSQDFGLKLIDNFMNWNP